LVGQRRLACSQIANGWLFGLLLHFFVPLPWTCCGFDVEALSWLLELFLQRYILEAARELAILLTPLLQLEHPLFDDVVSKVSVLLHRLHKFFGEADRIAVLGLHGVVAGVVATNDMEEVVDVVTDPAVEATSGAADAAGF
jgi:hypothetical protein